MTHLVSSMAYAGEVPWHGIGNRLDRKQPLEVWAKQSGLNFRIEEAPVCYQAWTARSTNALMTFAANKVLYRSDTKAALSVVSDRYQVVQPREILEFYRDLTQMSGFELETAGTLRGGRKVWALAKTGQSSTLKGNDTVNGYLLLATACDGSLATTAQFTSIRVVCNNTLTVALANGGGAVKVPHRTIFDSSAVKKQLGISISSWDNFMYRMKALSERKVKPQEATNYFLRVFKDGIEPAIQPGQERTLKAVQALYEGSGKGADLASASGTAWGLVNSVTQFVDHERRARSTDHRLDSAWFGQGATIKKNALDQALVMIS
jgi:phage/plasmid-like protein (TIGR03299 family)